MSRTTNARRRISLLATSSFVASTMMAGAGGLALTALTPFQAYAANECSTPTTPASNGTNPDFFVCAGGTAFATGITYTTDGSLNLALQDNVITTTGGIQVTTSKADQLYIGRTVLVKGAADPSIINAAGSGIGVSGGTGNININLSDPDLTGGSGIVVQGTTGISLNNQGGANPITVTMTNGTVTGTAGHGIETYSSAGTTTLNLGNATINGQGANSAIRSTSNNGGAIDITSTGTITGSYGGVRVATTGAITLDLTNVTSTGPLAAVYAAGGSGAIGITTRGAIKGANGGINATTVDGAIDVNVASGSVDGGAKFGINAFSTGSGAIDVKGAVGTNIESAGQGGIYAASSFTGTGSVTVDFHGTVGKNAPVNGVGVEAQVLNANSTAALVVNIGNVNSVGTGVYAYNRGSGTVDVTTDIGTNVNSTLADGIDAFAYSGDVHVTLLDGAIHSNSANINNLPSGGTGGTGGALLPDPNGIWAKSGKDGSVTVLTEDDIVNVGPGNGIRTDTYDGANTVTVDAAVHNYGGDAVKATSTGYGDVTVNLGTFAGTKTTVSDIKTTFGNGVLADQTYANGTRFATVNSTAGGNVTVTNANLGNVGVGARIEGDAGLASIKFSGTAGGTVSVEGAGANGGLVAEANDTRGDGFAGSAAVTTNDGLNINVGLLGGDNDIGIAAITHDGADNNRYAAVTLGNANTIKVGTAGSVGGIGVEAIGAGGAGFHGDSVTINGGDKNNITVNSGGGIGVFAQVAAGSAFGKYQYGNINVDLGDSGAIKVAVGAGNAGQGILAQNLYKYGNTDVTVGTTTVSIDKGEGIQAGAIKGHVYVTAGGAVTSSLGDGIYSYNDNGPITVNAVDTTGAGTGFSGIKVNSKLSVPGGLITVNSTGTAKGDFAGINVQDNNTFGQVVVDANNATQTAKDSGHGAVYVFSAGADVQVTTHGALNAGGNGIYVYSNNNVADVVVNTTGGTINAYQDGIRVHTNGIIHVSNQAGITAGDNGIYANTYGTGSGGIAGANDAIVITTTGGINAGANSAYGDNQGVHAEIENSLNKDNIKIDIEANVTSNGHAVYAENDGLGGINIKVGSGVALTANRYGEDGIHTLIDNFNNTVGVNVASYGASISAQHDGIRVTNDGHGVVNVVNNAAISNVEDAGIRVSGEDGAINIKNTASIDGNYANYGIIATDLTGPIVINNTGRIGAYGASGGSGPSGPGITGDGIYARSTAGNTVGISVTNSGNIYMANGSNAGIFAENAGTGLVSVVNKGNIDPAAFGIQDIGGGNVYTYNSGNIVAGTGIHSESTSAGTNYVDVVVAGGSVKGTAGNGIEALDNVAGNSSNIYVTVDNGVPITGHTNGIYGRGGGNVTVSTGTGNVTGGTGYGINAESNPTVGSGPGGAVVVTTFGAVSGDGGIRAVAGGTDNNPVGGNVNSVTVTANGSVIGTEGDGIFAQANAGPVNVTSTAYVSGQADGINAGGLDSAPVTVTASTNNTTSQGVAVYGYENGIVAHSVKGGNVTVTTTGDVIGEYDTGIRATTSGTNVAGISGNVVVSTNTQANLLSQKVPSANDVYGYLYGIYAASTGTGTTTINVGTNVNSHYTGIRSIAGEDGTINIASGVTVRGDGADDGTSYDDVAVIRVTTGTDYSSNVTVINNKGTIKSNSSGTDTYDDLAIQADGGGIIVNNDGRLEGRVDFSGLAAGFASVINNTKLASWHTSGTSTFSGGADVVNNSGLLAANGVTKFVGLEDLNNSGLIALGDPSGALSSDNQINDSLTATDTVLHGLAGSKLGIDANLWSTTQTSCATLTAADCLSIKSSTGSTAIVVNDTNAHAFGAYNPTGITIVTGATSGTFTLSSASEWFNAGGTNNFGGATNVLDKPGMFFYQLAFSGGKEILVSSPKLAAFEFASIGGASQDIWYMSTQTWFDRQADLRDTVDGRATGGKPAVWLKVVGDWTKRTNHEAFSSLAGPLVFNTSYKQDTAGIIGGVDFLNVTDKDKAWVAGLQGGYIDSNMRFRQSATRVALHGVDIGGYATYMQGGLFIDGTINANLLDMTVNNPGLGGTPSPFSSHGHLTTWGGQVEAGYAFPMGATVFIEPLGSLAYGRTSFDTLAVPGGALGFHDSDTLRGSLGARIGTTAAFQYYKVKVALEGRAWDEFDGKTRTVMAVDAGPDFLNQNSIKGAYGEVKGEANVFSLTSGLSGFANAGVKWKSRYQDATVTAGFRYQW